MKSTNASPTSASSGFVAKAARVASGHAVGYGVALLASPLLARLYGPAAFGVYAMFVLAISSLGVAATLRFDQAVPLASSPRRAARVTLVSLAGVVVVTMLVLAAAPLVEALLHRCGVRRLPDLWSPLLATGVGCWAVYQWAAAWMLRTSAYADLARMRVVFAIAMTAAQLAIPLVGGDLRLGLPAGQAVGFAAGAMFGAWRLRHDAPRLQLRMPRKWAAVVWRYRQFAVFGVPASVVSNLGIHLPAVLLAACYGLEVAGWFALAQRVFTTPLTLLTHSFSRVFFGEASQRTLGQPLAELFATASRSGLMLAAPPIVLVAAIAPATFGPLFGDEWTAAGWFCTLLAPLAVAMSVSQIVSPVFDVVGTLRQRLVRELATTLLIAGGLLLAWRLGASATWAVATASVGGCVGYAALVLLAAGHAQAYDAPSTDTQVALDRAA